VTGLIRQAEKMRTCLRSRGRFAAFLGAIYLSYLGRELIALGDLATVLGQISAEVYQISSETLMDCSEAYHLAVNAWRGLCSWGRKEPDIATQVQGALALLLIAWGLSDDSKEEARKVRSLSPGGLEADREGRAAEVGTQESRKREVPTRPRMDISRVVKRPAREGYSSPSRATSNSRGTVSSSLEKRSRP
jgi:hypothetical protein